MAFMVVCIVLNSPYYSILVAHTHPKSNLGEFDTSLLYAVIGKRCLCVTNSRTGLGKEVRVLFDYCCPKKVYTLLEYRTDSSTSKTL